MENSLKFLQLRFEEAFKERGAKADFLRKTKLFASQLESWINGSSPTLDNLDRIAEGLGLKPWELIGPKELQPRVKTERPSLDEVIASIRRVIQEPLSAPKRRIVDLLSALDDSQASFYLNMIEKELAAARGPSGAKSTIKTKKER